MRILITGGMGFVGSNIFKALKDRHDVTVVDDLSFGSRKNMDDGTPFFKTDFDKLTTEHLNMYDILIHCATVNINYAIKKPIETFKINALNTILLFNRFRGKIIYTSTSSVYGQSEILPTAETAEQRVFNSYDQSKLIAEEYLKLRGDYTTLRLSNVYGENQRPDNPYSGVVGQFIYKILKGEAVNIYGDGLSTRDYTHVSDVVSAVELFIERESANCVYNISGGNEISTVNLAKKIALITGLPLTIKFVEKRKIDRIKRRWLDTSLAEYDLGWRAKVDFDKGLKQTIKWIENEYHSVLSCTDN